MVPTIKEVSKVFVEVIYKYNMYAKLLNDVNAHNNDNKVGSNN